MRKILRSISLVVLFVVYGLTINAQPRIATLLSSLFPDFTLLNYFKGNFVGSQNDAYVAFYQNKAQDSDYPDHSITHVAVVTFRGDGIDKILPIMHNNIYDGKVEFLSGGYPLNKFSMQFVNRSQFGQWNGYCEIADSNHNGIDEILFFEATGFSFLPYIFEYDSHEMREVFTPPLLNDNIVTKLQTSESNGRYYVTVFGPNNPKNPKEEDWFKFGWNPEKGIYAQVETGKSKDPFTWTSGG